MGKCNGEQVGFSFAWSSRAESMRTSRALDTGFVRFATVVRHVRFVVPSRRRVAIFERASGEVVERGYDILVGADGVNIRVRNALEDQVSDFTVRQREV